MFSKSPKRPSQSRFAKAPQVGISRSTFDLSFPYKCTFDSGKLIPFLVQEVLPGDSFNTRVTAFARLATPLHPTLDNLHFESFFFFVPNRLVWQSWQKFMGEQDNPEDSTDYAIPRISGSTPMGEGTPADYMGLPIGLVPNNTRISALPFRGMNLVWNEWFRDENLQDSRPVQRDDTSDGTGTNQYGQLPVRGKRKDYISSALPWPQKGPGVDIPIGEEAPLIVTGPPTFEGNISGQSVGFLEQQTATGDVRTSSPSDTTEELIWNNPGLTTDLSAATSVTINQLRQAFQIQKLMERDARGGTRYTEILKSHFQVTSPDQRLQRPEYLGGGYAPIQMGVVPQTSESTDTTPQGNLSAYATTTALRHGFTKSFVEHGYILGFFSVRADLNYQERLDRHWRRQTKYDFYWPALQSIGEQAVLNSEVYHSGTASDDLTWGYQERWAEYRSNLGKICGRFRSASSAPLDAWHYAIDFDGNIPTLSPEFIQDAPPVKRTIAVQDEPEFLLDAWVQMKAARPMPIYSVPGYIDHF